jgi:dTDP-4-amino-4,6-dideoxygalactose transaminase
MRHEFVVFGRLTIDGPEIAEALESLRPGWTGTGPKEQRFETVLATGCSRVRVPVAPIVEGSP